MAVNDPPVVTPSGNLAYTEGDGAVALDDAITVTDADDTDLRTVTVRITGNYIFGEDILAFSDQLGITGSWNAATGTLTLTGPASVANFQTAVRSVTYQNLADAPAQIARTVTITACDMGAGSI